MKNDTSISATLSILGVSATLGVRLWPLGLWFRKRIDGYAAQAGPFYVVVLERMTAGEFVEKYTESRA
jgi:hypothetical protein